MLKLVLIAGLGIVVAGCDKGPSTEESARQTGDIRLENATAEEVIKQAAAAGTKNRIQPGEWENSVRIVSADMPGAPELLRKRMDAEIKNPRTTKECKKAEDAKAIDFAQLAPAAQGCTFPKYVIADGKIDADMVCTGPFGLIKMSIKGSQGTSAYDITVTQSQPLPGQSAESKMTLRATGKRLGDCKS